MQNRNATSPTTIVSIGSKQYEILSKDAEEISSKSDALHKVLEERNRKINSNEHFNCPNLDGSFKYIYTRDNCKYGIRFAQDLEIISDTKPLDKRDCCILCGDYKERINCGAVQIEELENKVTSSTENNKQGNKGKLTPDILRKFTMDSNHSFVLHFEMQNSGNIASITSRQKEYISAFKSSNRHRVETDLLSVSVLNKDPIADKEQPVKLFKKEKTFKIDAANGQDTNQMYILFRLGSQSGTISNTNKSETIGRAVEKIVNRWRSFEEDLLKKMRQEQGKASNEAVENQQEFEGAIKRMMRRNIALSLLGWFSEEEFNKYIQDQEIKEEFKCMDIRDMHNVYRDDMFEVLKESSGVYEAGIKAGIEAGIAEGEIRGTIDSIINLMEYSEAANKQKEALIKKITSLELKAFAIRELSARSASIENESDIVFISNLEKEIEALQAAGSQQMQSEVNNDTWVEAAHYAN